MHNGTGKIPDSMMEVDMCHQIQAGCALSAQARLSPAHIPWVPLMEILLGAHANGSLLICCASCIWLFFSCEKNSQGGKKSGWRDPAGTALLGEFSSTCSIETGTLQRVWWPWILTKISLHHPGNLADVSGVMMVFYPWKFSSQKRLPHSIGDSNKFNDVLGRYRSWLKCNFTDMHEATSEFIHPSKLGFSSLSASLLPFRSVRAVSAQGQTHCLLELKPWKVLL